MSSTGASAVAAATGKAHVTSLLDPSHPSPARFDPEDPIVLFIIQISLIVIGSRLLALVLSRARQPRVISEVIVGILLGKTAFGQIEGFTDKIFPAASLPYLNLVSTIGLCLFMLLVGLEVDFALFMRNWRTALSVSSAGMVLPFGLGSVAAVLLHREFMQGTGTTLGHFLLFIGTAMSITALPVLARILSELGLLGDRIGIIVLSAGVGNDVVGWLLLALAVSLVNAGSGLTVLYVILCALGYILLAFFVLKPGIKYLARRSGSFEQGPTQSIVTLALMTTFASSFLTDRIGIHALFGAFVTGMILPREGGFAVHLTEKLEDVVTILFLPLYFALSGLKTDLTLLNTETIWGYTVLVIVLAFAGKFVGCAAAARLCGFTIRESGAVGSLMSAKGLIELIVLNVGLSAGILTELVFSIFVLEAVLLTCLATPLTLLFYPLSQRPESKKSIRDGESAGLRQSGVGPRALRSSIVLENSENASSALVLAQLFFAGTQPPVVLPSMSPSSSREKASGITAAPSLRRRPSHAHNTASILRFNEITERQSALLNVDDDQASAADPLRALFRTFSGIQGSACAWSTVSSPRVDYMSALARHVEDQESELLLLPWRLEDRTGEGSVPSAGPGNPLASVFGWGSSNNTPEQSPLYATFIRNALQTVNIDALLYLDRGAFASDSPVRHLFLPFFGGSDDRKALELLKQLLSAHPETTATVLHVVRVGEPTTDDKGLGWGVAEGQGPPLASSSRDADVAGGAELTIGAGRGAIDTVYPTSRLASEASDDVALAELAKLPDGQSRRMTIARVETVQPLKMTAARAQSLVEAQILEGRTVICLVGRGRRDAPSHREEIGPILSASVQLGILKSSEVRKAVGDVASALLATGIDTSGVMVVQAGSPSA